MGRLFQYNRFGATENTHKKDTQLKNKMLRNAIKCPGYSDIYGQYNVDSSTLEKCEQWSSKLQFPAAAEHRDKQESSSQSRTHKVYDSMKNFLQRKLFAQPSQKDQQVLREEPTSDYDEDLLDSSYQADAEEEEEERDADCSCSSSSSGSVCSSNPATPKRSPQKSLLSLNCWQSSQPSSDSNPEEDDSEDNAEEDSDAGISDCCQLIKENSSFGASGKQRRPRFSSALQNSDDDEDDDGEPELLECPWYQPRITAKAAAEHLQKATPGSFLLRRSTPRHFELVLRVERAGKVKSYPVQSTRNQMYRLKGAKKQFTSLKALITHHSVMAEQLPLTLDLPRERHVRKPASVRYADDFEPLESLQLLGILKSLQARSIEI